MTNPQQLGFGFDEMLREQETAHLPGTMEEAIPYYRKLLERHNDAMLAGDVPEAMSIREEAHELAIKLNSGNELGICAPGGPGKLLERETAAATGAVPIWGQKGDFIVDVNGMRVRVEQDGLFGIGSFWSPTPGFSVHAVNYDKPFLSETGYRSFIGYRPDIEPGMTPDFVATEMIKDYLARECKGKPKRIEQTFVEHEMARRAAKSEQIEHPHD
jgi:hypothetical protein